MRRGSIPLMVEETLSGGESSAPVCPWCSATYTGEPVNCPSCGATLAGDAAADPSLPGLTAIDANAISRAKDQVKRSRSRLLSWISGDYPDQVQAADEFGALAPPDLDVRREMLRLELEAEVANLQAEAEALRAEATVEGRLEGVSPEDAAAAAAVIAEIDAVTAGLGRLDATLDTHPLGGDATAGAAVPATAAAPTGADAVAPPDTVGDTEDPKPA
jgi:hypothetical protein